MEIRNRCLEKIETVADERKNINILGMSRCNSLDEDMNSQQVALYQSKQKPWQGNQNCSKAFGMVKRQIKICKQNLDLMGTVSHAAVLTKDTCESQFSDRRWNCSSIRKSPRLTRDLVRGTREQAYLYAISSASLVHSVARACSIGVTTKCSCGALPNSPPDGEFKWGGCGDDVKFGLYLSESFTDASLSKRGKIRTSKKAQMNRHNNAAGRKIVSDSLTKACKCHGVSGSCSIKTCWKALPDFTSIGTILKRRYTTAVEVKRKRRKGVKIFLPLNPKISSITKDSLIYYTKSPDYCSPDPKTGSVGTAGRVCEKNGDGWGGCDTMCCGRGFKSFSIEITERCECKYYWCCYVKCKTCRKTLHLNTCR
ncbi:protein Wnt-11b-2-like isoform X1 [Pecten maximus]|uniref:protein Wnt-11b-2-like isoform X1 n=1 Tax=Pecten maximus TaxID=6579 RepID=UPI00145853BC|nr:protein Wnt-11b-2-like isoform X1 [Pecten maximus]